MEKIKLLLYCTKSKPMLRIAKEEFKKQKRARTYSEKDKKNFTLYITENMYEANGKIVAECDYEVEEIKHQGIGLVDLYETSLSEEDLCYLSCLTDKELHNYLKGKNGYAIHIKNLNIFDKPRELKNYKTKKEFLGGKLVFWKELKKAPQNMMYCYGKNTGEKYILISIRPEWLCKILNGEKTIEVRKKVLKEMIEQCK